MAYLVVVSKNTMLLISDDRIRHIFNLSINIFPTINTTKRYWLKTKYKLLGGLTATERLEWLQRGKKNQYPQMLTQI